MFPVRLKSDKETEYERTHGAHPERPTAASAELVLALSALEM